MLAAEPDVGTSFNVLTAAFVAGLHCSRSLHCRGQTREMMDYMTSFGSAEGKVLYLGVCAVPGADRTIERISAEQGAGWEVCLVATERALHWFDTDKAAQITGHPIQSRMRVYGEALFEPLGSKIVIAPAGFNSINKIAFGLADDMVSGLACEAIARQVPITIEPQMSDGFSNHPVFTESVSRLTDAGVEFIWHDESIRP
jgi:phosphopantothenoylcysteine decarboxylase